MATTRIGGAPVTTAHYARSSAVLLSSFIASMIGGVVMAVVMVVAFMLSGHDFLYALRPIGSYLYGDAMLTAPTPMMYGAAVAFHFGICAVWGLVFATAASLLRVDKSFGGALLLGIVIGLASQIVDINLITPPLQFGVWGNDLWTETVPPLYSWLGHVAFGISFVVAPAIFRKLWLRFSGRGDLMFDDPRIR